MRQFYRLGRFPGSEPSTVTPQHRTALASSAPANQAKPHL